MKLLPLKTNMTELELNDGTKILFSYKTPVAAVLLIDGLAQAVKTDKKWSNTTSRHINQWAKEFPHFLNNFDVRPQEFFDNLVSGVK